jgi:hypothetical protein
VEDRRGSKVGTVGEWELRDENLRAEDDSRGIGYFDGDDYTGQIRDHSGPDAWSKVERGCAVGGLFGGGCQRGRRGRIEVTSKISELSLFLKTFDTRFRSKSELPVTYQGFSGHLSQKKSKLSGKDHKPGFENNLQTKHRQTDRQIR